MHGQDLYTAIVVTIMFVIGAGLGFVKLVEGHRIKLWRHLDNLTEFHRRHSHTRAA